MMVENIVRPRFRKPRPLRATYDPSAPYVVERQDNGDGSISFDITDTRQAPYRFVCATNDMGNPMAKFDAEQIARGLNMLVCMGKETLPAVRDVPDLGYDEEQE